MRIMHISTRLILGGSQENTVLSCEGQAERGHTVSLLFGPIYGPEGSLYDRVQRFNKSKTSPTPSPLPSEGGRNGIELIETPKLVRELHPWKDRKCVRDLRQFIRDWKPDVVHTHSSKAGILGRIAAWKEDVPCVVHTIHGPPFHPYEKFWRNAVYTLAERFAAKLCHKLICVADAMRDLYLAKKIGRADQYVTVHSGMEVDRFLNPTVSRIHVRQELGLTEDDFVAGTIARLAEHKGHDDLLDAIEPLMREHNELKLLWVGDGWWRDRLLDRVRSLGLADRVITTGLVPSEDIPKYLQAMDILIHPSYREGLPRTVVQALLSGKPPIAYDVDGTREVCIEGETGKLIQPGDLNSLRDAVHWMMNHPNERSLMAERGQDMCRHQFDANVMVERLCQIYEDVLNEHSHSRPTSG